MQVLIFAGSTRRMSFNRQLAAAAAGLARDAGAEVSHIELADFDIPMYNADLEARGTPPDVIRLKQLMHANPAWIICSPEYNGSYPALLKNTLDWASSPVAGHPLWGDGTRPFRGKVAGLLSASPGALGGLRALSHLTPLLLNLGCWVTPRTYAVGGAREAFDTQGQLTGAQRVAGVQAVITQTLWAAQCLHPGVSAV
jgi:chromate reductase, NAD(P)H dehydrogenase (quinone)